jgi:signal transduction histidine kinase
MHGFDNTNLGMCVPDSDLARIRQAGIQSFIVMRLESESADEADGRRIGTLSYFFRRPHRFSWREVSLFRTFCRLVAGMIALHRQNAKLRESYQSLRLQSASMTRVEIVSLIAHDLFHKSFNTCHAIEEYIDKCRKTLNSRVEPRSHVHLEEDAACAMEAARTVQTALQQLRSLQSRGTEEFEKESEFDLRDVFTEIEDSLAGALSRNKLLVRRDFLDKLPVYGARTALTHVFFNLVINSIDAARTRATRRPMAIHVSAKVDESGTDHRLVVQYWDEGPGISRTAFKHPNEIFEIGRSTKPDGAGTGLPVARVLLARYFRGNLALVDPAKALFRVTIPLNRHRCGA